MGKRRFTPEYKEEIVKLVTERKKKISEVARDIGVTSTSIRRWITQYSEYGKDAFPGKGNLRAEDDRIETLKEKTPDLEELHFDGAYGSSENDKKFEQHDIIPVQTGVRGKKPVFEMDVEQISDTEYTVHCPLQSVTSKPTRKRHKAIFDHTICKRCPLRNECPTIKRKNDRVFYFDHAYYLSNKREKMIESIPVNRRKLKSNVEATVNEFVHRMPNRKVKVKGALKTSVFAFMVALSVNFGRIYRLIQVDPSFYRSIFLYFTQFVKDRIQLLKEYTIKIIKCMLFNKKLFRFHSFTANFAVSEP